MRGLHARDSLFCRLLLHVAGNPANLIANGVPQQEMYADVRVDDMKLLFFDNGNLISSSDALPPVPDRRARD